jgi:DNA-binding NarL/FixJ family response regulator
MASPVVSLTCALGFHRNILEREKEILHMMIESNSYKATAQKTFISYGTVRTHVKNIYKKLPLNFGQLKHRL